MQTVLNDLTGTPVERADKAEAQLNQAAVDAIISATPAGQTSGGGGSHVAVGAPPPTGEEAALFSTVQKKVREAVRETASGMAAAGMGQSPTLA